MTEDFDEGQRRRALQRVHLVAGISLGALIVLLANYLGFRNFERWDMTSEARYTLSDRTVQTVEALEREITITLLLSEGEEEFADVRELLSRYDAASPLLRVREVDPDRQADVARGLAQRYDLNLQSMGGSDPHGHDHGGGGDHTTLSDVAALLTRGERFWKVTRDDLIAIGTGEDGPRVDVQAERAITGALVALERNEKTRVCTTTGRGERTIDAGDRGLRYLRDELARENAEVETLDGFGEGFAEGCDAVFVLGPRSAFRSEEAQALVDYAKEGGRLLLALDPNVRRSGVLPSAR
ncbi:MAG: GldG family protein [Pseudomonadota bacterium]